MILAFENDIGVEILKAGLNALVAVITLALGWLIGQRLTSFWAIRQKRRELELSTANEFYKLYGEFFAVWKLWNYFEERQTQPGFPSETHWELLKRASAAEAGIEATLVKLASERVLNSEQTERLARFRQAYQKLRESIRDNKKLDWTYPTHPEYLAFKNLATYVTCMITSSDQDNLLIKEGMLPIDVPKVPSPDEASAALRDITSNKWKGRWAT